MGLDRGEVDALGVEAAENEDVALEAEGMVEGCHGGVHCTPSSGGVRRRVGVAGGRVCDGSRVRVGQMEGGVEGGGFPIFARYFRMAATAASYPAWYAQ